MNVQIVDLFAGPGGLAEGFSRFRVRRKSDRFPFEVRLSAEMDPDAHATLRLRTFFRLCERLGSVPESYYEYLRGEVANPFTNSTRELWELAGQEALQVTLGSPQGDLKLESSLNAQLSPKEDWILVGGPPCQAYSLVGRARNSGIAGYRAEADSRYFLYREYLRVLARGEGPVAFVMENVTGLLSATVGGEKIFPTILRGLAHPGKALGLSSKQRYILHSLTHAGDNGSFGENLAIPPERFIVKAEDYGVPQSRHRVIVVGIREDIGRAPTALRRQDTVTCGEMLDSLPKLRCALTDQGSCTWGGRLSAAFSEAVRNGLEAQIDGKVFFAMRESMSRLEALPAPSPRKPFHSNDGARNLVSRVPEGLQRWMSSPRLRGFLNHSARGHMSSDLVRYLFCASFGVRFNRSPRREEFPQSLAPKHKNWESGDFGDRFRVQVRGEPSKTVTKHISKDGHAFIHPDPRQCRSLTVREAARLQTFPEDYFFEGSRTAQFGQVGNAVPPFLASQIAESIYDALS